MTEGEGAGQVEFKARESCSDLGVKHEQYETAAGGEVT